MQGYSSHTQYGVGKNEEGKHDRDGRVEGKITFCRSSSGHPLPSAPSPGALNGKQQQHQQQDERLQQRSSKVQHSRH